MRKQRISLLVILGLVGWGQITLAETAMTSTASIAFVPNPDEVNHIHLTEKENGLTIDMPIFNEGLTIQTHLLNHPTESNVTVHYVTPLQEPLSIRLSEESISLLDSQYRGKVQLTYSGSVKEKPTLPFIKTQPPIIVEHAIVMAP